MVKNMIELNKIYNEDCLEGMKRIDDKSIDMILCDLPYGTTACHWDTIIPFEPLWNQYERVIKDNGAIVLTGNQPFTSKLVCSNLNLFRYSMIWEKESATGHLNANYKPLSIFEDILIFSKGKIGSLSKNKIIYYPQGIIEINKLKKNNPKSNWRKNKGYLSLNNKLNSDTEFVQKYSNYPNNILKFSRDICGLHPTAKPVALFEYLIRTYTNENETILDNCMGSGTTAIACINTNRNYIGFELDVKYHAIAEKRILDCLQQKKLQL